MSADAASLSCPVCLHNGVFNCAMSLRDRLIYVSTNKISCPVCQEEICGLDKLTIHLFSHVKLITKQECSGKRDKLKKGDLETVNRTVETTQLKKQRPTTGTKNKTACSGNAQIKFVKIYPKPPVISLTTMPVIQTVETPASFLPSANSTCVKTLKSEQTSLQPQSACNVCGLQFVDINILRMHMCLIHNNENLKHDIARYDCHLCPKSFKMRGSLMVHLRVAHYGFTNESSVNSNLDCKILDEKSDKIGNEKLISLDRSDNKQWQCDVCRKCFTTKYFLKKHKRLHTGETPYACTQCNKTFTFQQSYHKHLLYHNDEKPHSCTYCGRAFKELSTLHNHQRIHTGEKPFSCETCGKCFRQRVSYLVHRRIHTGAMPYKCTACEKSFRYKVSQRTHKCQAQPPGTVVRQSGELVEKLKKKNVENNSPPTECEEQSKQSINYNDISKANAELALIGAKLSLEDTETESFSFIDEVFNKSDKTKHCDASSISKIVNSNNSDLFGPNIEEMIDLGLDNVPSPSEILEKLCLSKEDDCNVWDIKANKT